jgi:hypothetical protein
VEGMGRMRKDRQRKHKKRVNEISNNWYGQREIAVVEKPIKVNSEVRASQGLLKT